MSRPKLVRPITDLLLIFIGPAIWFGHFAIIYGAGTLTCIGPAAPAGSQLLWSYALATVVALGGLGLLAAFMARDNQFLPRVALTLVLLAIAAVLWTALPAVFLPSCAS